MNAIDHALTAPAPRLLIDPVVALVRLSLVAAPLALLLALARAL